MDQYIQIKVLGKGAFGSAWLVQRKSDKVHFVAKEVRLANMKPADREAAKHEISMLRQLNHPNITRYVDHFEARGSLFIVMEYANGGDLYTKIKSRNGKLFSEKEILHYFSQICLALMHLHDKRILHRDLKTQNIFLTSDGIVKMGDFGISTVLRNTYELKRTVCGTPYYFSPELCLNRPYNNKSDVWALGCILYELTTLTHAFDGTSMKALVQRILKGVYPPIHRSYSPELAKLIASTLKLDPQHRPNVHDIVGSPYMRGYLENLKEDVTAAQVDNRPYVSAADQIKQKNEILARMKAEEEAKKVQQARDARQRDDERQKRLDDLRKQMEVRQKEHEDQLNRIKAQQNERAAQEQERKRALEARVREQRKQQQERAAGQARVLQQREEEWERNMAAQQVARQRRDETPPPQQQQYNSPPPAQKAGGYDPAEAARLYREMRREAEANRLRAEQDRQVPPPRRASPAEYAPAPVAEQRPDPSPSPAKKKLSAEELEEARKQAFWQMRREAEENKKRLLGVVDDREDPKPPQEQAPQQAAPAPESPADEVSTEEDEDIGYHKFLNNDAVVAEEADRDQKRDADYTGVKNAISDALASCAASKHHEDFGDVGDADPTKFVLDGQTLHLPNCNTEHPLMSRIESLRVFLEHSIGEDAFIRAYRIMDNISAEGDEDSLRMVEAILPASNHRFIPVIAQLIVCESFFNDS